MDDVNTLYRSDAPDTSKEAAESIDPSRLEAIVLSVIKTFKNGCISDEVRECCEEKYNIKSYSSVTARYASLSRKHLISFSGETRPGKSGRGQRVMFAVMEKNDG